MSVADRCGIAESRDWFDRVVSEFDRLGILWALMRPPDSLGSGDVDVLVAPDSIAIASRTLIELGARSVPGGWPGDHLLLVHDRIARRFTWWHLQPFVRIDLVDVPAPDLLARRVATDGVTTLAGCDLLGVLLLHGLFDHGAVRERHRDAVASLAASGSELSTWAADLARARGVSYSDLVALAADRRWDEVERTVEGRHRAQPTLRAKVTGRLARVRRWWLTPGLSVAIVGPDGAGKTTLVRTLGDRLPVATHSAYMGLTGGRLPLADRLRVPGLVLAARVSLIWTRWLHASTHRWRGKVVVFDRFPIDGLIPAGEASGRWRRWSRSIQARVCRPPDVGVLLDAPGTWLHARSGEYDEIVLESWRRHYLKVAQRRPWLHVVDATRPAEIVADDVVDIVWQALEHRWTARE